MKKIKESILLVIVAVMAFSFSTEAQKLFPHPPLFGFPAKTLPQSHWVLRGYWINNNYDKMWNGTESKMIDTPENISFSTNVYWGKVRYGITSNLTFIMNVPYVQKSFKKNGIEKSGIGLGDIIGALLYKFYHNKKEKFLLSGLLFTKSPTGKYQNIGSSEMPLGTGSFDYGFALLPEKEIGKWDFRLSAFYLVRGNGAAGENFGDLISCALSGAYNFSKKIIAETTLNYKKTFDNRKDGVDVSDSDTYLLQIVPGIQYRIGDRFFIQAVAPVNLVQKRAFGDSYETWLGLYYMI